ncbi:MAG: carboxyl transferase, partial [Lachnospiraceae bacterium]|nr:carboxyl transferase [Lachnospiraceae bacterium]
TVDEEKTIAKSAAKLTYAFASATVAKVNVVVGDAFGSAYTVMNAKSTGCDIVYAWGTAHIGSMPAANAARIIYDEELKSADDKNAFLAEKSAEYEAMQTSALSAAKRGYVDSIIEPCDTRKYVIGALEMLYAKREDKLNKKHGTV